MRQLKFTVVFIAVITAIIGGYLYFRKIKQNQSQPAPGELQAVSGTVLDVALNDSVVLIKDRNGDDVNLAISPDTRIYNPSSTAVGIDFLVKGFSVQANGTKGDSNDFNATEIRIVSAPNIIIDSPGTSSTVSGTFTVQGRARVFENRFSIRVLANSQEVYSVHALSNAPDAGKFGEFRQQIQLNTSSSTLQGISGITLEVFDSSPKDGSETDKVSIPLQLQSGDTMIVKVFFSNGKMDSSYSCNQVAPVSRTLPRTFAVARAALTELLKGPTDDEKTQGFFTSINPEVQIQSLIIDASSTAHADFDNTLQQGIAGSCKVSAIRAQITQTLEQFPGIHNVVISVNGNSTSTLQP